MSAQDILDSAEVHHAVACEDYISQIESLNPHIPAEFRPSFRELLRQAVTFGSFLEHISPTPE